MDFASKGYFRSMRDAQFEPQEVALIGPGQYAQGKQVSLGANLVGEKPI